MSEKLGVAMRDKYWNERNADEKISVLRDEVMQLRYQLSSALTILESLLVHSHADGTVVVPIDRNGGNPRREYYVPVALQNNEERS